MGGALSGLFSLTHTGEALQGTRTERKPRGEQLPPPEPSVILQLRPSQTLTAEARGCARAIPPLSGAARVSPFGQSGVSAASRLAPPRPRPRPGGERRARAQSWHSRALGEAKRVSYSGQLRLSPASRAAPPWGGSTHRRGCPGSALWGWLREVAYRVASACLRAGLLRACAVQSNSSLSAIRGSL